MNVRTNCNSMPRCVMRYLQLYSFIFNFSWWKKVSIFYLGNKGFAHQQDVFALD